MAEMELVEITISLATMEAFIVNIMKMEKD
jgi:hypothetical protein